MVSIKLKIKLNLNKYVQSLIEVNTFAKNIRN